MSPEYSFVEFFRDAMGSETDPYPFQKRLALREELPHLLDVPTGLGKTAAVALAWLFRRRHHPDKLIRDATPRRLVYCLPMRTLVKQTEDAARQWLDNLNCKDEIAVHVLMGGEGKTDWDLWPERDAILIGTQDMLLSRALNRGYGMSRYRWPMHFGLLNNDCLWVFDELQLMDTGVATSAQLAGFRQKLKTSFKTHSLWMSATLNPKWLDTVDFDLRSLGEPEGLDDDEKKICSIAQRLEAPKELQRTDANMGDVSKAADSIATIHEGGTRTLAIFNTVKRAVEVYKELKKKTPAAELVLIHSRFRQPDRDEKMNQLLADPPPEGIIAVTTQVVEAGVDVSAKTLFTEVAPWSSLVQRFGRCNRTGEFTDDDPAHVFWFDLPKSDKARKEVTNPYELDDLLKAREQLQHCEDVGPASLSAIDVKMNLDAPHVIRRRDLLDLFDTTPDLAGNDIDISRFIRSGQEFDVQVFWREWDQPKGHESPPAEKSWRRVGRDELCSAPVGEFSKFATDAGRKNKVWRWDYFHGEWVRPDKDAIYAGQSYLVHASAGGYDNLGWCGTAEKQPVDPLGPAELKGLSDDAYDDDGLSKTDRWQTIAEHTDEVVAELRTILGELGLSAIDEEVLETAARWHDWGKAHEKFQIKIDDGQELAANGTNGVPLLRRERPAEWRGCRVVAKAPGERKDSEGNVRDIGFWSRITKKDGGRIHFRHELASALAVLQKPNQDLRRHSDDDLNLVAYLIAAHHGKVRLSIRSMPNELRPRDEEGQRRVECRFARGIWDNDPIPEVDLGDGVNAPSVTLSLEPMEIGLCEKEPFKDQPSWLERALRLLVRLGPFRLAYLEALLRAADMRASTAISGNIDRGGEA